MVVTVGATLVGPQPLAGRRVLVTGATSGIGERTAHNLSVLGGEILVNGRAPSKVDAVVSGLRREGGMVSGFTADLTDRSALRSLVEDLASRYSALDVLINNAGAVFSERKETTSGSERTFALNVEAPFLLTELLLPLLAKSGHGRVVTVSSAAHRSGRMHFDDLDLRRGYSTWKAYGQSKLGVLLLNHQQALVHRALPVTFNACHPGFVRSRFGDEGRGAGAWALRAAKRIGAVSVERGARTPTFLASAADVEHVSGEYFIGMRPHATSRRAGRTEDAERLWDMLQARTGLRVAGGAGETTVSASAV
jgi:NAD(P)-dependent dehydrogenase (short-subunit alcohol dehydrogenase family)